MRVIIIEDKDCEALVNELGLAKFELIGARYEVLEKQAVLDIHRAFHFKVVSWLQAQGWRS